MVTKKFRKGTNQHGARATRIKMSSLYCNKEYDAISRGLRPRRMRYMPGQRRSLAPSRVWAPYARRMSHKLVPHGSRRMPHLSLTPHHAAAFRRRAHSRPAHGDLHATEHDRGGSTPSAFYESSHGQDPRRVRPKARSEILPVPSQTRRGTRDARSSPEGRRWALRGAHGTRAGAAGRYLPGGDRIRVGGAKAAHV